jgi:acetyltransferase-like isoleucine patch superfamily enzyme
MFLCVEREDHKQVKNHPKLKAFSKNLIFGAFTYFERLTWFWINVLPKFARKPFYKMVFADYGKRVFIDENCYFRYPWKISLGDDVVINRGCEFYPSFKNPIAKIKIESGTIIAPNVIFYGAGQEPENPSIVDVAGDITIGRRVYIGGNTVIRYGVTVGEGSVVGAGSVVVKNVSEGYIVAGNPATIIRSIKT